MTNDQKHLRVHDKHFKIFIECSTLEQRISELASLINKEYADKCPLFVSVLNGSFMFTATLLKNITIPCEVTFVRVASYESTSSSGHVKEVLGLKENLENRDVIILEDIIDTGLTMCEIKEQLWAKNPKTLELATLFLKPEALKKPMDIKYTGFEIENKFVLGYGLDYDGLGRNLADLYVLA
ncbi:hypoxanthine phosphoribosyltransferase [Pseudarcicella hirudinis]|uniref:Hypoxanthine phosphoribosyltransferase n=1 Tax=Pseudarcicella hirudinis TaxID=1079859 RepID=A0A1I5QWG6_9BACT|nr:hypoxanthine phosphoribosyltransferase [Pseudarcicella hirudinis]SFP50592.1 hypoxanthine phosphoribosyltransferase [Pseudarcicella hirudinis]